jgi:two-component system sensor histidine kinase MtrB
MFVGTWERQFTAEVAHELRTPLTGMSACSALIADRVDELPVDVQRPVSILVDDVDRLRTLVLELLELARLDAGTGVPRAAPLRLADAVRAVVDEAETRRDAVMPIDVGDTIVVGDLLDNAVAHGAQPIVVTARDRDGAVVIDVADQGPGIATDDLESVFDRLAKSDRSRSNGGSGLGLAIAREYARSLGGDVTAASGPGGGARFTLRLPGVQARRRDRTVTRVWVCLTVAWADREHAPSDDRRRRDR